MLSLFSSNQSGQVAVFFAFSLVPICLMVGFTLDQQTQIHREYSVQAALDSAVLAAAKSRQTGANDAEVKADLVNFINPKINALPGLNCDPLSISMPAASREIEAEIECDQDTSLMHMMGQETMPLKVESTASYALTAIDVAFVFDVSGSMRNGNRLVDLKSAVTDAFNVLLPSTATAEMVENTRIAIASFSSMLNAGPYFEQVTGLPPERSYSDTVLSEIQDSEVARGRRYSELRVFLYDADTGNRIAEIGDGAVIKVEPDQIDNITIVVEPKSTYYRAGDFESVEFDLTGEETKRAGESVEPFTLYGDSGMSNLDGEQWSTGAFELDLTVYDGNGLTGNHVVDKTIAFELFKDGDVRESDQSFVLRSTCVWEREGDEKFTDAPPGPGNYLAAHSAWYRQYSQTSPNGYWQVGFNEHGEHDHTGNICRTPPPQELTNNRTALDTYVSTMQADGSTAGHLGVAWGWYLISDQWSAIFDDTAAPALYTDTEIKKAVILMTDGAFNKYGYRSQGDSPTQAKAICDGMKAKGVLVYGIAFKAPSEGQEVLEYCATNSDMYFNATDTAKLNEAYKQIAVELSDLRIAK
ncbi:MAG: TadE/TadG family type IV pilus assembly protein [Pseudomonadota bacterium]